MGQVEESKASGVKVPRQAEEKQEVGAGSKGGKD
jgi:hypothetical protein